MVLSAGCVATGLNFLKPGWEIVSSAFMGAAVSTAVASLIEFLQAPDNRKIPYQFVEAAISEVYLIGYYREYQDVHIDFIRTNSVGGHEERIAIRFESNLIPAKKDEDWTLSKERMPRLKVDPPPGLELLGAPSYRINGQPVSSTSPILHGSAQESFEVNYRVSENSPEYSDIHEWLAPILGYELYFNIPRGFACEAYEIIGTADGFPIAQSRRFSRSKRYCVQKSAFSRQGFRWKIVRSGSIN